MGLISRFIEKKQAKEQQRNLACNSYILRMDGAVQEMQALFSDVTQYINPQVAEEFQKRGRQLKEELDNLQDRSIKKAVHYPLLLEKQEVFFQEIFSLSNKISVHNDHVAAAQASAVYAVIGDVEGRRLDQQQLSCIAKKAHNHLVIAGAGTGKTTTVVGKIKYLLKTRQCAPEDLLVLSFTNASAAEMRERIAKETGENIATSTFHKLGLNIITSVNHVVPKISSLKVRKFIKEQLDMHMKDEQYLHLLSSYLCYYRIKAKSEFDFTSAKEYEEYLHLNPPTTLRNETVKSYGEMDIANFLEQNGIAYRYEDPYAIDTRTEEFGQYRPDFYLPDYDIYIEYFGINRKCEVPSYFSGKHGLSATEAYRASMKWKQETHKANNTKLITCYAYEKWEGTLLKNLKTNLEKESVTLSRKTGKQLWEQVSAGNDSAIDGMVELFETLINLLKSNQYTIQDIRQRNTGKDAQENAILLWLLEPIFTAYCTYLEQNGEIDFNDMINLATKYVQEKKFVNPYSYVIVDEYQDISKARFTLLKALRESANFDLFCVGDDWQSIYRFAGSDIGFILHFSTYWGPTEISKIETTYRFTQKLIEVSSHFIMQNPLQIQKSICGKTDGTGFALGEIKGYTEKSAVSFMLERLQDLPKKSTVFFIGRYAFDAKILEENEHLSCHYNTASGQIDVQYDRRPDLKMQFVTAHKSKGLQADYVFIINNKNTKMGFPSKIQDAPILGLLLNQHEDYPFAEERRLFYVAMTRAKKKAILLTVKSQESSFVKELKSVYENEISREKYECPLCGARLIKRQGKFGEFYGCANYKNNGCNYTRTIHTNGHVSPTGINR